MNWQAIVRETLSRYHATPDEDVVLELSEHAEAAWRAALADDVPSDRAGAEVQALVEGWCQDSATARRPKRLLLVEPPRTGGVTGVLQDVRYGLRMLRRQPGATVMALVVIAVGIGATATLFSLVYGVLLRPLPWPEPDRLVQATETREGQTHSLPNILTSATYLAWRDHPATLESLAAYDDAPATLSGGAEAERIRVASVTASLFTVLRVRPVLGTLFTEADETPSGGRVVLLSYGLWQRRYGGTDVIGHSLELNGEPYSIAGVLPADFLFPDPSDAAWRPLYVPPVLGPDPATRSVAMFSVIGKLRPGATPEEAAAEGTARSHTAPDLGLVGIAVFGTQGPATVHVRPYLDAVTGEVRPALLVLFVSVGLLLAGAMANVAGMQLARTVGRRRELAIRAALGAGTARLARQLLIEHVIVGLAGGVVGLLLAALIHRALPSLLPPDFPRLTDIAVDWRVAIVAIGTAVVASLVFGWLPASLTRRLNLVEAITEDSLAPAGGQLRTRVTRARALIMAGQVAVASLLLVGALLLARSFEGLLHFDRGFEVHHLLTAELPLPTGPYTGLKRAAAIDALLTRLQSVPGVAHAGAASILPLVPRDVMMGVLLPASAGGAVAGTNAQASLRLVSPDYFSTLGIRLVAGRGFQSTDTITSEPVAVVNRTFVRRYVAGSPFDVKLPLRAHDSFRIVGVIDDVRGKRATDPPQAEVYLAYDQLSDGIDVDLPAVVVQTTGDPRELAQTLRALVHEMDPSVAFQSVMAMDTRLQSTLARPRLYAIVLGAFAGFALLISGLGLFSVLSYSIAQRSREIGVRTALGARPRDIVGLVIRQGLTVTVWGLAIGLGAAFVLARNLAALLYGVTATDLASFAAVPVVLVAVAALACYLPARRAARVDPLSVLRGN